MFFARVSGRNKTFVKIFFLGAPQACRGETASVNIHTSQLLLYWHDSQQLIFVPRFLPSNHQYFSSHLCARSIEVTFSHAMFCSCYVHDMFMLCSWYVHVLICLMTFCQVMAFCLWIFYINVAISLEHSPLRHIEKIRAMFLRHVMCHHLNCHDNKDIFSSWHYHDLIMISTWHHHTLTSTEHHHEITMISWYSHHFILTNSYHNITYAIISWYHQDTMATSWHNGIMA